MFWHEFVYEIRRLLRQKEELFWMLMFPVILGTLFYFAMSIVTLMRTRNPWLLFLLHLPGPTWQLTLPVIRFRVI